MRITIDATAMLVRSAGVKNYIFHWLRALRAAAQPGEEIRAFPFLNEVPVLDHERSAKPLIPTLARLAAVHAVNTFGGGVLDRLLQGADIFHAANLTRHAPSKARLTATIHDMTAWIMPEHHTRGVARGDLLFAERVLKRADGLIAVSENTRQDAIRLLGIAPEKIRTIHSGVADEYFDAQPHRRAKPYVLYAGTIEPRKNLNTLLDAWKALKPSLRQEYDLLIAGPEGWHAAETLARIRSEATYLGYVAEREMPGLFAGATVFVYPSLYEGFGFPVVQAMAAGAPVLTSNTSCLPEITGDAAVLIDPHSVAQCASGLTRLLQSEAERTRHSDAGRARARQFQWQRCAAESLALFRRVRSS